LTQARGPGESESTAMPGSEATIQSGYLVLGLVIAALFLWRFILWVREAPGTADPWGPELEAKLRDPETALVCARCSTPQPPAQWFCEHCGSAVGDYNNYMPYVHVFSEGEVLRNGVSDRIRLSALTIAGFLLLSLNLYLVAAPVYWYFLIRNWNRLGRERSRLAAPEV
jgi:hypothetical protein